MKTFTSKRELINAMQGGLFYVEQPHGLTAYDLGEREPKTLTVDGEEVDDLLAIDAASASAINAIVEGLNDKNRELLLSWSWCAIGETAWEVLGKGAKRYAATD